VRRSRINKLRKKHLKPRSDWGGCLSDRTAKLRDRVAEFQNGIQEKPRDKVAALVPSGQDQKHAIFEFLMWQGQVQASNLGVAWPKLETSLRAALI